MLNNMNPKKWGKYFWGTIYYVIINYPKTPSDEDKLRIKEFFELLKYLLPCQNCTNHYTGYLSKYPLSNDILSSRELLLIWAVKINNEINKRLGKKEYTVEETLDYYTTEESKSDYSKQITTILLVILIILLICYIKFK